MPNITRKNQKIFAANATNNGQFGSLQDATKILSQDLDILQANAAYPLGWNSAALTGEELPSVEEFQSLNYINTSQIAYLLNKGIPEWVIGAEYFIGDIQREVAGTKIYRSITDNNIGNILTDVVNWQLLGDLANLDNGTVAASQAEVNAGVVADKYVAPSTLLGLFGLSTQGDDSASKIPVNVSSSFNELIIQKGRISGASPIETITFTTPFSNTEYSITANHNTNPSVGQSISVYNKTTTQCTLEQIDSSGTPQTVRADWVAIGY